MKIMNKNDKASVYLWDRYMTKLLLANHTVFSLSDIEDESGELIGEWISVAEMVPIYILRSMSEIKADMLENYYKFSSEDEESHGEYGDVLEVLNHIDISVATNGRLQSISFPDLDELAENLRIANFGRNYDDYHDTFIVDWLLAIYENFLETLSDLMASGEFIYRIRRDYYIGGTDPEEMTEYAFYMRNKANRWNTIYYETRKSSLIDNLYRYMTHRFVYAPAPTNMDMYNVF